jgi:phosphopantothenoylcysteine decarboxylase/phosphopantothenate--cysteine ligase
MERVPLILAPAMNREMWQHPATQRNVKQLEDDGAVVLDVGQGEQACGEVGDGRMLEPWEIIEELESFFLPKPLLGTKACVTAGPTYEAIDPVRGLTNRSSGKMGFAIARALQEAGAQVTLVAGPVCLSTPRGVQRVNVQSAREMMAAVQTATSNARLFVACAAVADWRPQQSKDQKIKKQEGSAPAAIALEENPDILATVAHSDRARSGQLFCVGFAAETENLQVHAQAKRQRKGVPLLVANVGPDTFGLDDNALTLFEDAGETQLARTDKLTLARQLVAHVAMRMPT